MFYDYAKDFDCVNHSKLWEILREMGIPDHLTCLLRNLYAGQEATVELDMEQCTGSKLRKKYVKAVYCHPAYLMYMQSSSWEMLGWMKHKLESRLLGEISITSDMQITPSLSLLRKVKEESESWLKAQHSKNYDHGIPSLHANRWGKSGKWQV